MDDLLPPSPARVRAARAVGLRPRSRYLVLAGLALLVWALLGLGPRVAALLSARLVLAFEGAAGPPVVELEPSLARACGAGLVALLAVGVIAAARVGARARARRALGVGAEHEIVPAWQALLACGVALVLGVWINLPSLAGAARSVDAPPALLAELWLAWARRASLTLAMIAGGVGLLERRSSARRLWQGLHQTRAEAREQARAAGRR